MPVGWHVGAYDLWLDFFQVTACLSAGVLVLMNSGLVYFLWCSKQARPQ